MKKILAALVCGLLGIVLCGAAFAAEPLLLDQTRSGNAFYLTSCEQSEGRITVVIQCRLSDSERAKTAALLGKQGVPAADAQRVQTNEFSLRYSEDGHRYQRLYDRYVGGQGELVRNLNQNPDAWYDTPSQANVLPAKALLEAARILGVSVSLPEAVADKSDAASLQSNSPKRVMEVAEMCAAYRADRALFTANYENALIQVRGVRGVVSRDFDSLSVLLLPSGSEEGILCLFSDDDAASVTQTPKGAQIVVEGVFRPRKTDKGVFVLESCAILSRGK